MMTLQYNKLYIGYIVPTTNKITNKKVLCSDLVWRQNKRKDQKKCYLYISSTLDDNVKTNQIPSQLYIFCINKKIQGYFYPQSDPPSCLIEFFKEINIFMS